MKLDKDNLTIPLAKQSLDMQVDETNDIDLGKEGGKSDQVIAMLTYGNIPQGSLDGAAEKDRKKRTKKDGANSTSAGSAGSREDLVRAQ
jgi:hypothetical protein